MYYHCLGKKVKSIFLCFFCFFVCTFVAIFFIIFYLFFQLPEGIGEITLGQHTEAKLVGVRRTELAIGRFPGCALSLAIPITDWFFSGVCVCSQRRQPIVVLEYYHYQLSRANHSIESALVQRLSHLLSRVIHTRARFVEPIVVELERTVRAGLWSSCSFG